MRFHFSQGSGYWRCQNLSRPATPVQISGSCTTFLGPLERSAVWKLPKTVSETLAGIKTVKPLTAVLNKGKSNFSSYRDQIWVLELLSQTTWLWYHPTPSSHVDAVDLNICVLAEGQHMTGKTELVTWSLSFLSRKGKMVEVDPLHEPPFAALCFETSCGQT